MNFFQKIKNYDKVVKELDDMRDSVEFWRKKCVSAEDNYEKAIDDLRQARIKACDYYDSLRDSIVTLTCEAPANEKRPAHVIMKLQNELVKFIRIKDGKATIKVQIQK